MDWFVYADGLRHESVKFLSLTIKKGSRSLSTKVNIHFHDMVKIHIKIILFLPYTELLQVIEILTKIYQNKIKMSGKN